jgi:putative CocE/NonD family hydrolase
VRTTIPALSLVLACGACGACATRVGPAIAEPRKPADAPLVSESLDDDAHLAKALREHYTKYEYAIPMRDGVKLFTVAYVPKDRSRTWPILLERTPYGVQPYGVDNYADEKNTRALNKLAPAPSFVRHGFIFVHQDVRGRMSSEGTFVDVRPHAAKKGDIDESTDAWDTVDWLVKNLPANNGKVGLWGISYPGFYAAQAAVDAHPAVRAISPQAPVTEWFLGDDFHHNGAFFLADAFNFYSSFGKPRPKPVKKSTWGFDYDAGDAYEFFLTLGPVANANTKYLEDKIPFWNDLMVHGTRDAFWQARDPRPYYRNAKPAVMTVGGWFDVEDLFGTLATYRAFETQSPKSAENVLVMGPWRHGGWARTDGDHLGDVTFGQKTAQFFRDEIELPFFERHLEGKKGPPPPEAIVFETGTNTWQRYATWPPAEAKPTTLFFQAGGKLGATPPREAGADAYVSDPQKPVPYRAKLSQTIDEDYASDDQRFAARRPDVLVYATGELDADASIAGPVEASLWVTTTGSDADFVVKVVDVYPADHAELPGYQQLVRAEIMRGKFRSGFDRPEAFKPGEPTLVRFTLPDVCHTFRTGHKLMVQVQSSWFPLVDRNPQTFTDIYKATAADFHAATHRVLRAPDKASSIRVMLERGALP